MSEDDLVARARGDRSAFAALYDRYYPRILRYCLRRLFVREIPAADPSAVAEAAAVAARGALRAIGDGGTIGVEVSAARPAEVPKFRYSPLSEVRLQEALLIREFRVVYM